MSKAVTFVCIRKYLVHPYFGYVFAMFVINFGYVILMIVHNTILITVRHPHKQKSFSCYGAEREISRGGRFFVGKGGYWTGWVDSLGGMG